VTRRTAIFSPFAASLLLGSTSGTQPQTIRVRTFRLDYNVTVKDVPAAAHQLDLWIPVPHDDPWQQIESLTITSPYQYTIAAAHNGNRMLHLEVNQMKERTLSVSLELKASRKEHVQFRLLNGSRLASDESNQLIRPYLRPDRLVPVNEQIRSWAQDVVYQAHAQTDLEMARAIYNHVISTVKYDKSGEGWGRGDIYYACEKRRGNCTDFHSIFIGYCRAVGIPARFAIGFPLPTRRGAGIIAGYHCWAEFYAKGIGWVPVDASEAQKNPAKREYFFGAHDENRIELSKGRDVMLVPRQRGEPLNYFVYPYAEINGKAFAGVEHEVTYQDTSASQLATLRPTN
jgi:transglutaminase-like putative cysteine protease